MRLSPTLNSSIHGLLSCYVCSLGPLRPLYRRVKPYRRDATRLDSSATSPSHWSASATNWLVGIALLDRCRCRCILGPGAATAARSRLPLNPVDGPKGCLGCTAAAAPRPHGDGDVVHSVVTGPAGCPGCCLVAKALVTAPPCRVTPLDTRQAAVAPVIVTALPLPTGGDVRPGYSALVTVAVLYCVIAPVGLAAVVPAFCDTDYRSNPLPAARF